MPGGVAYQPQLDGLRALAVLLVIAFHARGAQFPGGYIGVDVFFVLSGFLITSILAAEHARHGRISFGRFYFRRALRLLPALILVCAVVGAAWIWVPALPDRRATLIGDIAALTYTSAPIAASGASDLGAMLPTWSLSVEEYFYFVWPLLFIVLLRRFRDRADLVVAVLVAVAIAYRLYVAVGTDWSITRIAYGPDARAEQLLLGCALALLLRRYSASIRTWQVLLAAAVLGAFVLAPATATSPVYLYGGSTAIAVITALLIAHLVGSPGAPVSRLLALPPLVWIGQRSYGIYLWNLPLIAMVAATSLGSSTQLAAKLVLSFAIPALSYRFLEAPFLRLKDRFSSIPTPGRDAAIRP